ncbi:MAG: hypothetical protein JJE45_00345 [Prolixibacteraceae bacterium]|nr:hypothetical protein [Prolixibacteraceae bacterium]
MRITNSMNKEIINQPRAIMHSLLFGLSGTPLSIGATLFVKPMAFKRKLLGNPGLKFGRVTVIEEFYKPNNKGGRERYVKCLCDCGNITEKALAQLYKYENRNANCGCMTNQLHSKHRMSNTRLYRVWDAMVQRITNPNDSSYHNYGGRNISICEEWKKFIPFMEWALSHGYKDTLEIDREDNDGNYEPSNCRFVTRRVNQLNKRKRPDYGIFYRSWELRPYSIYLGSNGKSYYGGNAETIEEARKIRDSFEVMLRGRKGSDSQLEINYKL